MGLFVMGNGLVFPSFPIYRPLSFITALGYFLHQHYTFPLSNYSVTKIGLSSELR